MVGTSIDKRRHNSFFPVDTTFSTPGNYLFTPFALMGDSNKLKLNIFWMRELPSRYERNRRYIVNFGHVKVPEKNQLIVPYTNFKIVDRFFNDVYVDANIDPNLQEFRKGSIGEPIENTKNTIIRLMGSDESELVAAVYLLDEADKTHKFRHADLIGISEFKPKEGYHDLRKSIDAVIKKEYYK